MNEIMESLMNYQDRVIVNLISEGLTLEEIADLELSNVDTERSELKLHVRTVKVSQLAIKDIMKAYHEEMYFRDNGDSEDEPLPLIVSWKIVRGTDNERTTIEVINERIGMIEKEFDVKLKGSGL